MTKATGGWLPHSKFSKEYQKPLSSLYFISRKKYREYEKALEIWSREGVPEKQPKLAEWFAWVARLLKFQDE